MPIADLPVAAVRLVDDRVVEANADFAHLVRTSEEALHGTPAAALFAPEEAARLSGALAAADLGWFEAAGVAGDGAPFLVSVRVVPRGGGAESVVLAAPAGPPVEIASGAPSPAPAAGLLTGALDASVNPWVRAGLDRVLSHDVRGALRGVTSFLTLLGRELGDLEGVVGDYYATASAAAGRADVMVERIVHLARLDLRLLRLAPVDLATLVDGAVRASIESLAPTEGEEVSPEQRSLPVVWGDAALLTGCLAELITNARKFSDRRASVRLASGRSVGPWRYLQVSDDGPGVDPEFVDEAFAPFRLLQPKGRYPGVGMGLAIVRRTIEVHGGRAWISADDGPGTTVWVRLLAAS